MQHAFDNVQPGQTVCFRAGTYPLTVSSGYNQRLKNSGTSSSPITFTNYPGEVAIIHGNTLVAGAYVTFVGTPAVAPGFIFEGPTGQALDIVDILNTHDVTFDHVEIRNGDYHAGLYQSGGYNIKLIGCYVHDNGRPGSINSDQGIYWDATTGGGNLIANCVVEHNVSAGIQLYPSPSQVTVEENTIVNNGNYGAVVYGDQNAIVNNIFSDNGVIANNPQMEVHSGTNQVIDSNIFWSSTASLQGYINLTNVPVTHSLNTNPLFVDPANHNYHLQAGSPAIKAGNASYALPEDKDGVQRDSLSDLGAYVYTPPPIVAVGGVVDPWTSASGLAPGSWITIYGKNFGVTSASWNPVPGGPLPTSLGGVGVQVSGLPAALSFINATQINALVPAAVAPGLAQVIVSKNGVAANPVVVSVDPQRPVVYAVMDPEHIGNYYVTAALAGTSDLIGKPGIDPRVARGARPGESIDFYLTGLGATADPSAFVTDQLFTSAAPVAATVTIQLGSQKIAPSFAGLTAPGLYLVRVVIPASIAPGDQLIQFDANGFHSPGQVYLTISEP